MRHRPGSGAAHRVCSLGVHRLVSRHLTGLRLLVPASVCALLLAGCASDSQGSGRAADPDDSSAGSPSAPAPATVKVNPATGSKGVMPDAVIDVHVLRGDLSKVSVTGPQGARVDGDLDGQTWSSTSRMKPATTYTIGVTADGPQGGTTTQESTFTTHDPQVTATYGVVYDGQTVGIGMPVSLQFDSEVTNETYREAIERAVSVTTVPEVEGSWGWLDHRQLMWRPKDFWEPGTKISVEAPLTGFQTGEDKWVSESVSGSMTIGREQMTMVDIDDHEMRVTRAGQTLKSYPVSSGKPGKETETRSGMKVVIGKQQEMTMDSTTVGIGKGDPDYYSVDTDSNVRVTWTGEFIHSAPWSVDSQGSSNVSHGCVNVAPDNAQWFYDNSMPGDPVEFTGSERQFEPTEGIGVWQYSWEQWQAQSALR